MATKVKLSSSDTQQFEVDEEVAFESVTVKNMIEDTGGEEVIPLPNVSGKILARVIEYCKYHVDANKKGADAKPAKSEEEVKVRAACARARARGAPPRPAQPPPAPAPAWHGLLTPPCAPWHARLQSWDAEFVKVDQATLFDLILAANYLNIKGLLDLTCQTVAQMIKGKTPEVRGRGGAGRAGGAGRKVHGGATQRCAAAPGAAPRRVGPRRAGRGGGGRGGGSAAQGAPREALAFGRPAHVAPPPRRATPRPQEIRKQFHIKNDFTPEEEEEVRRENQWAFD